MHRALYVADISRIICDYADRNTLASLARCCKALHTEATAVLWRTLDDLAPLVATLPGDSWIVEGRLLNLTRPLLPSDWTTFLKLASYVRAITSPLHPPDPYIESIASARLSRDVISLLATQRPQQVIFPHLLSLQQDALSLMGGKVDDFLSMVGPQLAELDIDWFDSPGQLLRALTVIYTKFPQLRRFSLAWSDDEDSMPTPLSISPAWIASSSLAEFDCEQLALTEEAIGALSSLPNLEALTVRLPQRTSFPHIKSTNSPFSNVLALNIVASARTYLAFSEAVGSFPRVRDFRLQVDYTLVNNVLTLDLVASISGSLVPEIVTALSVCAYDDDRAVLVGGIVNDGLTFFTSGDFRPLLKFGHMSDFTFELPCIFQFDDALLLDVAKAWPELEAFYLGTEPYCLWAPPPTTPTLRALPPFAVHCPLLCDLGFQFNANVSIEHEPGSSLYGELLETSSCSRSRLRWMHVARSPILAAPEVTAFLSCVFPRLVELNYGSFERAGAAGPNFERRWREVAAFLPAMATVRGNERKRVELELEDARSDSDSSGGTL